MPQDKSAFDDQNFDKEELKKSLQAGCSDTPAKALNLDCDQSGGRAIKNVGITEAEQKAYLASRPYKAERSSLHKGIFAKPGHTYLKVTVRSKIKKYTNVRQFPTKDLNQGVMNHLYDKMYEEILSQYNLR